MSKKHIKRNTALILSLVMLFVVILPITASAAIKVTAPKQIFVDIGGTTQINVVTAPAADLTMLGLTYKSANEQIAAVDNTGLVSGIGKGSTTITVKYGKKTFKVTALVSEKGVPYTDGATFSIEYPESWTVTENEKNFKVFFTSPRTSQSDQFKEFFGVTYTDSNEISYSVDDVTNLAISQYKIILNNFKLLANKKIHISNHEARLTQFSYMQGIFTIKNNTYYIIANNKIFVICYVTEKNSFDSYAIEMQKMLNSFKILG